MKDKEWTHTRQTQFFKSFQQNFKSSVHEIISLLRPLKISYFITLILHNFKEFLFITINGLTLLKLKENPQKFCGKKSA